MTKNSISDGKNQEKKLSHLLEGEAPETKGNLMKRIIKATKEKYIPLMMVGTIATSGVAGKALAKDIKFAGPDVDIKKYEEVTSSKTQTLPSYIEMGGKKVKVTYEADSGKIGNDASEGGIEMKDGNILSEYKIDRDHLDMFNNNLSQAQKKQVLTILGEAKNKYKLTNENISEVAQGWIMYDYSINQKKEYIKMKGKVGKDFDTGVGVYITLKQIKDICPEMITQEDLTNAKEFDKEFRDYVKQIGEEAKKGIEKAEKEGREAEEESKKAKKLMELLEKFK
ncbi:hypothetical protein KAZ01_03575 [Candidatus Gracilibacteria bacterium]|nr:hypothetical protein [Candidatus Gracilibacteria bacterium]